MRLVSLAHLQRVVRRFQVLAYVEASCKLPRQRRAGCDSGLGLHIARRLHEHGFQIFAGCLDPNSDGALILKEQKVAVLAVDYLDEESIVQAYRNVTNMLGERGEERLKRCASRPIRQF